MLLTSCKGRQEGAPTASSSASPSIAAVQVEAVPVRLASLPDRISAVGTFQAISSVNVTPKLAGLVVKAPVHTGQFVAMGGVILQLDTADLEAQLRQDRADLAAEQTKLGLSRIDQQLSNDRDVPAVRKARASLENARLQWERSRNLYRADLIAQKDLQDAKTEYLKAQADYQTAIDNVKTNKASVLIKRAQLQADELKLRNATVRAPFSGFVSACNVDVGDYVTPGGSATSGSPYVTLLTLDPIYCQMQIGEINSQKLRLGQSLEIRTVAYPGKVFNGVVYRLSPALDAATRTVRISARLSNPEKLLKPGLYGNCTITLGVTPDVRLVPQMAQTESAGEAHVFIAETTPSGTVARQVVITRGRLDGNWVEAKDASFKGGTPVIVTNLQHLYDGAPVQVTRTLDQPPAVPQAGP